MAYKHQGFVSGETILEAKHLINMEDAIINLSSDSYKYGTTECIQAFVSEMNKKAQVIGATNSNFVDPIGINNTSTAHDMARIILNASDYEKLYDIWNTPTRDLNIIKSDGSVRTLTISSTVVNGSSSPYLTDYYNVMGGKTGSLSTGNIRNLVCICQSNKNPDDWYAIAVLKATGTDGSAENRFQAAKDVMDYIENGARPMDSLDEIAWENMSYRDIFIKNNKALKVSQNKTTGYTVSSGSPAIVSYDGTEENFVGPYALKCFGQASQQFKSDSQISNYPYFAASKIKIDRYVKGYCGIALYTNFSACQSSVTNGWVTTAKMLSDRDGKGDTAASVIYVGSASSANLDGYINNPVLIPMNIFKTAPTEEQMIQMYEDYSSKVVTIGGSDQVVSGGEACCESAYAIKKPNHNARAFRYIELDPVFDKESDIVIKPASTTKILTSLVCLDYVPNLKDKVLITQDVIDYVPSGFNGKDLFANETITFEDLLYAMFLPSSNVACSVVARAVGERILRSKKL